MGSAMLGVTQLIRRGIVDCYAVAGLQAFDQETRLEEEYAGLVPVGFLFPISLFLLERVPKMVLFQHLQGARKVC